MRQSGGRANHSRADCRRDHGIDAGRHLGGKRSIWLDKIRDALLRCTERPGEVLPGETLLGALCEYHNQRRRQARHLVAVDGIAVVTEGDELQHVRMLPEHGSQSLCEGIDANARDLSRIRGFHPARLVAHRGLQGMHVGYTPHGDAHARLQMKLDQIHAVNMLVHPLDRATAHACIDLQDPHATLRGEPHVEVENPRRQAKRLHGSNAVRGNRSLDDMPVGSREAAARALEELPIALLVGVHDGAK
mmetsp:Transcript_104920/g.277219  ORF Transcript_104920/g.277219 Transcript_104920/m.277219 type:complete len:247 (+) Transcript_104920:613-1353(+)